LQAPAADAACARKPRMVFPQYCRLYPIRGSGEIDGVKSKLREWLEGAEFQKVVAAAEENGRTIGTLVTLTFEADALTRWRALDAIGRCAARLCAIRTEALKNLLRRLFWMMGDESGAIVWHAPEAIGEIIRSDPYRFADFIPTTLALLDLEPEDRPPFLPGILYALGRIGEAAPHTVEAALPGIIESLADADSQARAMAVWSLGQLGQHKILSRFRDLAEDPGEALVYRREQLVSTTVGRLWEEALSNAPSA
jgi:hypothetical protein